MFSPWVGHCVPETLLIFRFTLYFEGILDLHADVLPHLNSFSAQ
jgi:hypothetical protein